MPKSASELEPMSPTGTWRITGGAGTTSGSDRSVVLQPLRLYATARMTTISAVAFGSASSMLRVCVAPLALSPIRLAAEPTQAGSGSSAHCLVTPVARMVELTTGTFKVATTVWHSPIPVSPVPAHTAQLSSTCVIGQPIGTSVVSNATSHQRSPPGLRCDGDASDGVASCAC